MGCQGLPLPWEARGRDGVGMRSPTSLVRLQNQGQESEHPPSPPGGGVCINQGAGSGSFWETLV